MKGVAITGTLLLLAIAACVAPAPEGDSYTWAHATAGETTSPATDAGILAEAGEGVAPFDDESVLGVVAAQGYASFGRFSVPFPSVGAPGALVEEWVSANAVAAYDQILPDAGSGDVVMPVGSILVRALVDDGGAVTKLTLMAKGPRGYNPALGDWWFGVTNPSGVPLEADGGAMTGRLDACYSCHVPQRANDYLFGVPLQDRAPPAQ